MELLQQTLWGGTMVLVILLLRTLGKRFLPRTVFRALWIVAALRLLLPLSLALPVPMPAPATPLPAADAAATAKPGPGRIRCRISARRRRTLINLLRR